MLTKSWQLITYLIRSVLQTDKFSIHIYFINAHISSSRSWMRDANTTTGFWFFNINSLPLSPGCAHAAAWWCSRDCYTRRWAGCKLQPDKHEIQIQTLKNVLLSSFHFVNISNYLKSIVCCAYNVAPAVSYIYHFNDIKASQEKSSYAHFIHQYLFQKGKSSSEKNCKLIFEKYELLS